MQRFILLANAGRKPSNFSPTRGFFPAETAKRRSSRAPAARIFVTAAFGLVCSVVATPVAATPPENPITLPATMPPDKTADLEAPQALRAIKRVMQGETGLQTDDPVLQPVLQLLGQKSRERSSLELLPDRDELLGRDQPQANVPPNESTRPTGIAPTGIARSGGSTDQHWRAAEWLLKTSRLIDKLDPEDKNRQQLVNRMRQEAVRILTQTDRSAADPVAEPASPPHSDPLPSPDE